MRTRFFAAFIVPLILWGLVAAAQPSGGASAPVDEAIKQIRAEAIRAHIRFLADDLLEGRGTGTRGHELAAKYVAAQFEAMGLEPAGIGGTYFQPVPLRKIELVPEQSSLQLIREGKQHTLTFPQDFVMRGNELRTDSSVEAAVVFVGFGTTAPELNYDDYVGVDVRGKVVAYLYGAPPRFPSTRRAYYSSHEVKAANAARRGAVGILYFFTPEDQKRIPWRRVVPQVKEPGMRWLDEKGMPNDAEPEIRGRALLSHSGAQALFAGAPKSLEEVFAAARASQPQAFALPVTARIRTVSRHSLVQSPNVAAVLRGSDPRLRDDYVVYSAHVDHLGIGEPVAGDAIYNGALDNASGTAALLEVARAFAHLPQPPRRSVLFLAVTGEEKGLLGSDYFAHYPTVPLTKIVANVNMDEAAILYPIRDVVPFGAEHSSLGEVVAQAATRLGLEVSPDPMPEEVIFIRSDQYSFVRQGVPAVFIVEGFKSSDPKFDGGAISRQWSQTRYHTPKDDFNQPFDFNAAVKYTQLNFLVGYEVAEQTQRPTWNPGDFFGEKFGGNPKP